jgi:hypothetical protein
LSTILTLLYVLLLSLGADREREEKSWRIEAITVQKKYEMCGSERGDEVRSVGCMLASRGLAAASKPTPALLVGSTIRFLIELHA